MQAMSAFESVEESYPIFDSANAVESCITINMRGTPLNQMVIFELKENNDSPRILQLKKYRNIGSAIVGIILIAMLVAVLNGLPYQPFLALLLGFFGMLVVFVMKLADAS